MANTKEVEKEEFVKLKGRGKKAWPIAALVMLVSLRVPRGSIAESPLRLRPTPLNPWYKKLDALDEVVVIIARFRTRRGIKMSVVSIA